MDKLKRNFTKKIRKFENLFPLIRFVENLQEACYEIKSKSGNMTPRSDAIETIDGFDLELFKRILKKLVSSSYKYKSARRVHINKLGKSGKKLLNNLVLLLN